MKIKSVLFVGALLAMAVFTATQVQATPVQADNYGTLAQANWGGSGIDNTKVAYNMHDDVTYGMAATARFFADPVTWDGAGTYYAEGGESSSAPSGYMAWNFDFYVHKDGNNNNKFVLYYDFDPAAGTPLSQMGYINLGVTTTSQNSWNLGMGFLTTGLSGIVIPPSGPGYNVNALGEFSFALYEYTIAGAEVGHVSINVNNGPTPSTSVPDGGTTATLLGAGIAGLGLMRRKMKTA